MSAFFVIMQELEVLGVNNNITRWIGVFLRSRSQCVKIGDAVSSPISRTVESPRVQGWPLSCLIFWYNTILSSY